MKDITTAEMDCVLTLLKSPEIIYNATSLSKKVGITPMGALKILKRLAAENIVKSREIGKAMTYKVNLKDTYAKRYVSFLLLREAQHANPLPRRWITEAKKIKNAEVIILFGSVLDKPNPNDIDLLLVTDKKRFPKLQKEIQELNEINIKKVHPLYQTYEDIINNIKKRDTPLLSAIKGIVIAGEEKFLEIYDESRQE